MIIPVLAGILIGYLINYLSDILPYSPRQILPTCANQECKQPYPWTDYLLLRCCRKCGKRQRVRTFLVLVLAMIASLYLWFRPPVKLGFALGLLALTYLLLIAVIDFEHRLILRPLSFAGLTLTVITGFLMHGWQSTLIGGLFGFGVMFIFYLFGILVTRRIAKKQNQDPKEAEEAFGSGDVTLATILGLFLGWPLIWFGLLLGVLLLGIGVIPIAAGLLIKRRSRKETLMMYIPIGPPFILGTILLVYLPNWITAVLPK